MSWHAVQKNPCDLKSPGLRFRARLHFAGARCSQTFEV